jgi:hypothetical protein
VDTALALPVLTASTWYYVYAYNNAGSLALEYSTTVPTADLRSKTGDSTRAYLGCFVTDSAGKAIPMMQVGRRYTFRGGHTAITGTPLRLGDTAGQPAGPYTVSAKVPPHVEVCTVMYKSSASSTTAPRTAGVATTGDSAVHLHSWKSGANGEFQTGTAELVVVGGTIDLYASHATEVTCFADLTGFEE